MCSDVVPQVVTPGFGIEPILTSGATGNLAKLRLSTTRRPITFGNQNKSLDALDRAEGKHLHSRPQYEKCQPVSGEPTLINGFAKALRAFSRGPGDSFVALATGMGRRHPVWNWRRSRHGVWLPATYTMSLWHAVMLYLPSRWFRASEHNSQPSLLTMPDVQS